MPFQCDSGIHDWKDVYINSDSCDVQAQCSRCGMRKEQIVVVHDWKWVQQTPCLYKQVCNRCQSVGRTYEKEHRWRVISKSDSEEIEKRCSLCGITSVNPPIFPPWSAKFIGQDEVKHGLVKIIANARKEGKTLPHFLLCGQNGMGKVTLAKIIADEMGVNVKTISGKEVEREGDMVGILTNLRAGDFLIIEKIELMRTHVLDALLSALSGFVLDIVIGKGPSARNITLRLPHFTAIGTVSNPLQLDKRLENLMLVFNFVPYDSNEIGKMMPLFLTQQKTNIEPEASNLLISQSNRCPGEVAFLLKKAHEYAAAHGDGQITSTVAEKTIAIFGSNNKPPTNSPIFERQPIPDDIKMYVWKRDGGRCVKCGGRENLEYDHIIPVSKGGSNTARNIQLLCERCNRSKSANIV